MIELHQKRSAKKTYFNFPLLNSQRTKVKKLMISIVKDNKKRRLLSPFNGFIIKKGWMKPQVGV